MQILKIIKKIKNQKKKVTVMQAALKEETTKLQDAVNEKNQVEADAQASKDRLSLSERLVNGLSSESQRFFFF